ncbi:MAG: outer membrane beta-barrel protein [Candidatus Caldarchaeum sp.]
MFWAGKVFSWAVSFSVDKGFQSPWQVAFYGGRSLTQPSEITLHLPGQKTRLRFEGVRYSDRSFEMPIYYGVKVNYFLPKNPSLVFGVEVLHNKVYAQAERDVRAFGVENGVPVDRNQRLSDTVQKFDVSHGVNYLTFNVTYRPLSGRGGNFVPYLGLGLGVLLLHPENRVGGQAREQWEWDGFGWQVFLGGEYELGSGWSLFFEYKYTDSSVTVNVVDGWADTRLRTHHFAFGSAYRL